MSLTQAKMQESRKKKLSVPASAGKRKLSAVPTKMGDAAFCQSCRLPVFAGRIPEGVQNSVIQLCPTVRERTKNATVGDRHNIPHPFFDLGGWYKTLMSGRIADLFLTQDGFKGHAQQIEQELSRLIEAVPFITETNAVLAVIEYIRSIKNFIIKKAKEAHFDFPPFQFHFPYRTVLTIEKRGRILYINSRRQ